MDDVNGVLRRVTQVYHSGRDLSCFFDYDGTLAPIRPSPERATLPPIVRHGLVQLAKIPRVAVAVVSGRAIDQLKSMVEIDGLYYSGTSGLEVELRGERLVIPGLDQARKPLDDIAPQLDAITNRYDGAWLEVKPFGLTVHYRNVAKDQVGQLWVDAGAVLSPWTGTIHTDHVTLGIEIVPAVGRDKGTAVREILADTSTSAFPVYFGDGANDAAGLAAVDELGGLSVGVGPQPPPAAMRLGSAEDVGILITQLVVMLSDSSRDVEH